MKEEQGILKPAPQNSEPVPENPQAAEQVEGELVQGDLADLGPAQEAQLDAYRDNATIVIFDEKSQPSILQSLQSSDNPVQSIAETAYIVHTMLEKSLAKESEQMTEITLALGAAHIVSELVTLAEAAGLYQLPPEDRLEAYRHAVMRYFEQGLKDGSIDPVELQRSLEPLMNEQQRAFGLDQMQKQGVSKTAPPSGQYRARQKQAPQPEQQGPAFLGG